MLTQFHVILLVITMIAVFYVGYVIGNVDRRLPDMDNEDAMWWHTAEDSKTESEILEHVKKINDRAVPKVVEEPPF